MGLPVELDWWKRPCMRTFFLVAPIALLAGCKEQSAPASPSGPAAEAHDECNPLIPAKTEQDQRAAEDRALFRRAGEGKADAVAETTKAIAAGDFRLFGYSRMVPGIVPAAYGTTCRPDLAFPGVAYRLRGVFARSDVPGSAEMARTEARIGQHYSAFASRYNALITGHPRYPYRDLCRAVTIPVPVQALDSMPIPARDGLVSAYGYRDVVPTDDPVDLGEAARRGSLASLDRLATAAKGGVNRADDFGLTPLAWAIVYRRMDHARALLKHGASPSGAACRPADDPLSPLQLARTMRWKPMILELQPYLAAKAQRLSDPPRLIKMEMPEDERTALMEVYARHRAALPETYDAKAIVTVDRNGRGTGCKLQNPAGLADFDKRTCDLARTASRWEPARDEFGEAVAGAGIVPMRLRPEEN